MFLECTTAWECLELPHRSTKVPKLIKDDFSIWVDLSRRSRSWAEIEPTEEFLACFAEALGSPPDVISIKLFINDVFRVYYRMGMFGTALARRKKLRSEKR